MMCRASRASSRAVMSWSRIGSPVELPNVDFDRPDLSRALGHQRRRTSFSLPRDALGHRDAGIVAGLDDHAAQQILHLHPAVDRREHARCARRRPAGAPGIGADHEFVLELQPALHDLVEYDLRGHQLGQAGRRHQLVGVLLEQDRAAFGIDQDRVGALVLNSPSVRGLGAARPRPSTSAKPAQSSPPSRPPGRSDNRCPGMRRARLLVMWRVVWRRIAAIRRDSGAPQHPCLASPIQTNQCRQCRTGITPNRGRGRSSGRALERVRGRRGRLRHRIFRGHRNRRPSALRRCGGADTSTVSVCGSWHRRAQTDAPGATASFRGRGCRPGTWAMSMPGGCSTVRAPARAMPQRRQQGMSSLPRGAARPTYSTRTRASPCP